MKERDVADPVFDEAKAICLKNCFEILIDNLTLKEPEAQVRFQRCLHPLPQGPQARYHNRDAGRSH